MFVGHFAIAFGAKRLAPTISLGALFLACQLADLLWPNLVLLGIERFSIEPGSTAMTPLRFDYYPFSHSLLMLLVWGLLFAGLYRALSKVSALAFVTLVGVVLSHWILDVLTHRADMPLMPGDSTRLGLGLWNAPVLGVPLELALFGGGIWLYGRSTSARNRIGSVGLWSLAAFLLVVYVANLLGPPPPSLDAVAWSAQAMWLIVAWGYWVDHHRSPTEYDYNGV